MVKVNLRLLKKENVNILFLRFLILRGGYNKLKPHAAPHVTSRAWSWISWSEIHLSV